MNGIAATVGLWTSALLGLFSVLWQMKRVVAKINDFFEFVKGLEPELRQMKDSAVRTDAILTEHVRNHPGGENG